MIVYHFAFDLRLFGFVDWPVSEHPAWRGFAAAIASTFLFLTGVSLVLAHRERVRWRAFLNRLLVLALAAGAVTAATLIAMPHAPIYFGILHAIATFSVLALPFVRLPAMVALAGALSVFALAHSGALPTLHGALGYALGLLPQTPITLDYEPLFPWLGATLLGVAFAKTMRPRQTPQPASGLSRWLAFAGRHSLIIYLVHQPVLFAAFLGYQRLV